MSVKKQKSAGKNAVAVSKKRGEARRRIMLEQEIAAIITGSSGMSLLWDELLQCALNADAAGFIFYGNTFQKKAKQLKRDVKELEKISGNSADKKANGAEPPFGRPAVPFRYREECRCLLAASRRLKESGLLEREEIDAEELEAWAVFQSGIVR